MMTPLQLRQGTPIGLSTRGPSVVPNGIVGFALASGEYVLIVDSDMELTPGTVAACVATACGSDAAAIVVPERTVGSGFVAACRTLERRCYEGDSTIEAARFFAREAFVRHGGYDETLTGPGRLGSAGANVPIRRSRGSREQCDRSTTMREIFDLVTISARSTTTGRAFGRISDGTPILPVRNSTPVRPAFATELATTPREPIPQYGSRGSEGGRARCRGSGPRIDVRQATLIRSAATLVP